jgi:hypothetical protein
MLNFVYLRSSRLHFFAFFAWFMHCQQGSGEFEHVLGYWMHFESFQVVSSHFWALCVTGLTGRGHRSDRSECWPCSHLCIGLTGQSWVGAAALFLSSGWHAFVQGELHGSRGACMCAGGALCDFSSFCLVVCALCLSIVLSRMCWAVALA